MDRAGLHGRNRNTDCLQTARKNGSKAGWLRKSFDQALARLAFRDNSFLAPALPIRGRAGVAVRAGAFLPALIPGGGHVRPGDTVGCPPGTRLRLAPRQIRPQGRCQTICLSICSRHGISGSAESPSSQGRNRSLAGAKYNLKDMPARKINASLSLWTETDQVRACRFPRGQMAILPARLRAAKSHSASAALL